MTMKRREFLKTAVITGAVLSIPEGLSPLAGFLHAADPVDLAVARGPSPSRTVRAAVDGLGGIGKFISRGDVVVIKPNIGWDRTPEYAATTNPEVVAALIGLCLEAGAKKVKVFDHSVNDARRTYKQSGIADAAAKAGAEVGYMDDRKYREMKINGQILKTWPIYAEVVEADKMINVPIAKHHSLSTLTLGMKNWMGVIGGSRGRLHQNIDECLVDLAAFFKPALVVLDAVRILTANGPQGGWLPDVKRLDTIVAGRDQVAVDAYGTTLFGMKEGTLGCVRIGQQRRLGSMNVSKMKIKRINL
jgi:uncharacterized protein (DUF362 family)